MFRLLYHFWRWFILRINQFQKFHKYIFASVLENSANYFLCQQESSNLFAFTRARIAVCYLQFYIIFSHNNENESNIQFKDTLKVFDGFKNKQKIVWNNVFWYVKVCIFWKCIQYTIHWDKTQMLKKFSSDKINGTKNVLYFASSDSSQFDF